MSRLFLDKRLPKLFPFIPYPTSTSSTLQTMAATRLWDRYLFNTLPLPHTVLLLILLTVTLRIAISFHFHYGSRPVLTLCVVSSLLASISDTLAQMLEIIRERSKAIAKSKDKIGDIELRGKTPSPEWDSPRSSASAFTWSAVERPIFYDFPRMIRFMGYGFCFAPISVSPFQEGS